MKLYEVISNKQHLEEADFKKSVAAALLGATLATAGGVAANRSTDYHIPPYVQQQENEMGMLASNISSKYNIDKNASMKIVELAYKYADPVFPTAHDILAVIGVESSFNPKAKSELPYDPAIGLMQVRPLTWNLSPEELANEESQIRSGVTILKAYFKKLKNKDAALNAYNVGLRAYRDGQTNPNYVPKIKEELKQIKTVIASL